jgi:excisionase family DNA binding protein
MTDPTQVLVGAASRCTIVIGKETKAALIPPEATPEQALAHGLLDSGVFDALAEQAASHVAELVEPRSSEPEPWIGVEEAAEHLACKKSRVYALTSAGRIPFHKDGSRLLFLRSELDEWVRNGGDRRP